MGTGVGALIGGGAVVLGQHLSAQAQRDHAAVEWKERRELARADQQRAWILDAQVVLIENLEWARGVFQTMVDNEARGLVYEPEPYEHEQLRTRWDRADATAARIADEELRSAAMLVIASLRAVGASVYVSDSWPSLVAAGDHLEMFSKRAGQVLNTI